MDIEEQLLRSDRAIRDEEYSLAKSILYEVLEEAPESGKAHNDLGWLFQKKLSDPVQAERHYKYAIKFSPKLPSAYLNYIYMLRDQGRIAEMESLLQAAEKVNGVHRATLYDEYGTLYELKQEYDLAVESYKKAIQYTLNNEYIDDLKRHIRRCRDKKDFLRGNRIYKAFRVLLNKE